MKHDPVTAVTLLLLAAFAIDRTASAITFLFSRPTGEKVTDGEAARKAWNAKVFYFAVASFLAITILAVTDKIRLLASLGLLEGPPQPGDPTQLMDLWIDRCVTFIILVGGADRISSIVRVPAGDSGKKERPEPLVVQGTLTLHEGRREGAEGVETKTP